ncbi:DUF7123 family protein [Halovenus halobia]|uniref:DUF7123 family protein n=1 Tax=Halovenus halobia TaxID=3396622 RepID=UPI003F55A647
MPSHNAAKTDASDDEALTPKARQLLAYLDNEVESESYLKSRFIAQDIDLSSKEVGAMMAKLQNSAVGLTIEKWGYTNGTTWRIRAE